MHKVTETTLLILSLLLILSACSIDDIDLPDDIPMDTITMGMAIDTIHTL